MAIGWRANYSRYKGFFLNIAELYRKRQDLKMFLEIILSLSTITIFSLFALKPTALTIAKLVKEIKDKEATIKILDEKVKDLGIAQSVFSQEQKRISLLNSALPTEPKIDTFVKQLESVSTTGPTTVLGISLGEVTLVGEDKTKKPKEQVALLPQGVSGMVFSSNFSGSFEQILNVLNNLENMRRPLLIETVKIIKPKSTTENTEILNLAITGQVPYFKK